MGGIEIVPVGDPRALRQFIDFPYSFYRRDKYWVPPLKIAQRQLFDFQRHPFYRHAEAQCFLARRAAEPAGRITAILDSNYNEFHGELTGFFGFFESENHPEVATALLSAARDWLRQRGARIVRGPMNPSTNYECGLLVDGFDSSPQIMMTYNPPYYAALLEGAGLRKAKDLYAYWLPTAEFSMEKVGRVMGRAAPLNGFQIRRLDMGAFERDAEAIWQVYNGAWSRNWGFVPMTRDEFIFMTREMKPVLVRDLALLGEIDGRVVAFALALPDINQALKHANGRLFPLGLLKILYHKRSIRKMRVMVLGVLREYCATGIAAGLYAGLFEAADRLGYEGGELSWVLEDNVLMRRSLEALGGKPYKTYRIYEWN